jgi:HlyD family secretion protein
MAQQEGRSYRGWWITLIVVIACIVFFFYYRAQHNEVEVYAAHVQRETIRTTVSTNGIVEPVDYFQATAPFPGVVQEIYVDQGDHVTAGQPLVRMDNADALKAVAGAQANLQTALVGLQTMQHGGSQDDLLTVNNDLAAAEIQRKQAAASLGTLQKLQAQGAASANEVAAAQQRLNSDETRIQELHTRTADRYSNQDLTAQRAMVSEARIALAAAQQSLSKVTQRAPFAGTVYAVPVSQYDYVDAGKTLLELADMTKLQIRAYFDEPEIGGLAPGQPVKIVWDAKPNKVWHGHILQAPTTIIQYGATRNVGECLITVDDANGDLLPNTNVTVTVTTRESPNVLAVPREALQTDGASDFVYRIVGDRLVKTPIVVSVLNLTQVGIAQGLSEGDKVATGSPTETDLRNGLRVKVIDR